MCFGDRVWTKTLAAGRTGGERTLRIRERDAHLRTVVFFNEVGHEVVETPFNPRAA